MLLSTIVILELAGARYEKAVVYTNVHVTAIC
jgi:hypothetical protein